MADDPVNLNANSVIAALDLRPHPEGGHYREILRSPSVPGRRAAVTAIYYLLKAGERSHWHRIDATEIWHFHAGAALQLSVSQDGVATSTVALGTDFDAGEQPQAVVPVGAWQSAVSTGAWTLVGCTVAPAFEFAGFEMAPPDWAPTG